MWQQDQLFGRAAAAGRKRGRIAGVGGGGLKMAFSTGISRPCNKKFIVNI
jgi:hypothetical protein